MDEKVITLGNLTVFKEKIENEIPCNSLKQFSVDGDMWQPLSFAIGDYGYSAEIPFDGVTSDNCGHIDFDIHSISACVEAEVAPSGETEEGKIILYTKKIPSKTVSGICFIY